MASPQNLPPRNQGPKDPLKDLGGTEFERETSRGWPFGAGWTWLWIFVFIGLAIWLIGWGWGPFGGWVWGTRSHRTTNMAATYHIVGPGVSVLEARNKSAYVGQPFSIGNVPVQQTVSSSVVWIGPGNTQPLLVVLPISPRGPANPQVAFGLRVDVTGTVEKAPPQAQAKQNWSLTDKGAARLEEEGVYVRATVLKNSQH